MTVQESEPGQVTCAGEMDQESGVNTFSKQKKGGKGRLVHGEGG